MAKKKKEKAKVLKPQPVPYEIMFDFSEVCSYIEGKYKLKFKSDLWGFLTSDAFCCPSNGVPFTISKCELESKDLPEKLKKPIQLIIDEFKEYFEDDAITLVESW